MKMNILVPSDCCGPNTATKPLKWPSGNITPLVLIVTFWPSSRWCSSRSFVSASAKDRMLLRPSYATYGCPNDCMAHSRSNEQSTANLLQCALLLNAYRHPSVLANFPAKS